MRRIIIITGLLSFAALVWFLLQPKPVAVDLAEVSRGDMVQTVQDDGRTRIREKYIISAPLSGRLVRVDLDPGDVVTASETQVAVIQPTDPSLLDPRALAEAEARVKTAEARIAQLEPRLKLAEEKLNFSETELGRIQKLSEENATGKSDLDAAKLSFAVARSEYSDAVYAQQIAEFELKLAQAALIHTSDATATTDDKTEKAQAAAESREFQLPIRSPITGRVLRVFQESATVVAAGAPLLEVGDPADLEVEVDVLSSDAVRIEPGAMVFLEQWGGDKPLTGKVRLVEPSAFTKISALGIEEQRVNVIIDFESADEPPALGDGYRVDARIVTWQGQDVLKVPAGALFRSGNQWAVFRDVNNRAVTTLLKLGHRNDAEAEVLDGLSAGEHVVLHPGDLLQEGCLLKAR
ncbi:MAG: HlyD family efflux transporter periplasmic adaptor subunit [Planctomycetaceae bacterium]